MEELDTPVGRVMLRELLIVELDYRGQQGEQPTVEEYQALFPDHANLVPAVFGEAMDQRNRSQGTTTPPNSAAAVAEPPPPSESPRAPESIGRYEVVRRLGEGPSGTCT